VTLAFIMPKPVLVVGDQAKDMPHVGGVGVFEQGRSVLWLKAFDYLKEHPFSGIGFGRRSFGMKFPEMRTSNHQAWHAHSSFVDLALELGIQGLVVFCFLLYRIFRHLWTGRGRMAPFLQGSLSGAVMAAAWVMTAGYFIRNLTDDLYNNDAALLFWLLVGCAFSLKKFVLDPARAHLRPAEDPHASR
jgi:O-antigen ligase